MDRASQNSAIMSQKKGELMDIAKCVRIFELEPDDDFVLKRVAVIKDLRTRFLKIKTPSKLMAIGSGVCEVFRDSPSLPDSLATQVEVAIKKKSRSFVKDDRDLEMGVCAAMAVVESFNSSGKARDGFPSSDVLAVAIWSAVSFLPPCSEPKLEEFRVLAVESARSRILNTSLKTRERHDVPTVGVFGGEETTVEAFSRAIASTVDALQINAALDREEINLLWWVLGGVSKIFGRPLLSLSPAVRAVTTGVEIGELMRALPTQSHRNLALRGLDEKVMHSLPSLLEALGKDRLAVAVSFKDEPLIDDAPLVFPLLSALRSGKGAGLGADLPRPLSEWGARALLERAVLRIQYKDSRTI